MVGLDLNSLAAQAAPAVISQIDNALADLTVADDESKGLVIVPDGHGSYYLVKTIFSANAKEHMTNKGYEKVDKLIQNALNSILK